MLVSSSSSLSFCRVSARRWSSSERSRALTTKCIIYDRAGKPDNLQGKNEECELLHRRSALLSFVVLAASTALAVGAPQPIWALVDPKDFTDEQWRSILTRKQYSVLRKASTELPYSSPLNKELRAGIFHCAGCSNEVFESKTKFDSGTGWPSFYQAISGAVLEVEDNSIFFLPRTEVQCSNCGGHLGHVFGDGPEPTGLRYCMNGVALTFKST